MWGERQFTFGCRRRYSLADGQLPWRVEDEEALRRLAARVLIRAGYTVLSAASGDEALEVAAAHDGHIDLLLTDIVMPGISGRELAEQIIPVRPGLRLLYASGFTEDTIIRHGVSIQETAFLQKPFTPSTLLEKVIKVLGSPPVGRTPAVAANERRAPG